MHPRSPLAAGIDTAVVMTFVAVGRRTHQEGSAVAELVSTAAPFLIALAVAWVVWRVWHQPTGLLAGAQVWGTTLVLGMVLRGFVFGDGTAASFVIVTTVFLGACLLGWRVLYGAIERRRSVTS